jgi:hypothetical protein
MATSWTAIASATVSTATAANIDFTSIPSTYTDLCLKFSTRVNNAVNIVDDVYLSLNNVQTNFSMIRLFGTGTTAVSDNSGGNSNFIAQVPNASATANTFGNSEIYIPNYASSLNKSIYANSVSENNATAAYAFFGSLLWSNSAAINRITITGLGSSFVQYSTATLYGIKNS